MSGDSKLVNTSMIGAQKESSFVMEVMKLVCYAGLIALKAFIRVVEFL